MSDQASNPTVPPARAKRNGTGPRRASKPIPSAKDLGRRASAEAGRRAAALLEVLAGQCTPSQAATALGVSLPNFYLLERRALEGLAASCEPRPKGRGRPDTLRQLAQRERELARCQRECQRQAALARATQRVVGLAGLSNAGRSGSTKSGSTKSGSNGTGKGTVKGTGRTKRKRRPVVRALRAAKLLRENSSPPPEANGLEPCAASNGQPTGKESSHKEDHDAR
jgi:hypothetical protein